MRVLLVFVAVCLAVPVAAQDTVDPAQTAKRVGKLESEMRAVQRKVFPGGDPKFFTPEIVPAAPLPVVPDGNPASSPVADLTARVDALERQLRTLTGQAEEDQNKLRQLDTAMTKLRGDVEFRLTALEGTRPAAVDAAGVPPPAATTAAKPAAKPAAAKSDTQLLAAAGGDPVEAAWRAAYARYTAKDYDAAEAAFTDFIAANPKATRASHAQYWLGRSYLAQNSAAQAAKAFLDGYQKYPKGERAPDSLLWLGNALTALKKPEQACRALNELQSVYAAKLTPALKEQAAKARAQAKCEA